MDFSHWDSKRQMMTSEIRDVDALREAGKDEWQRRKQNTKDYSEPGSSRQ